ncbi:MULTISPECIES: two-component system response regulator [Kamptonema]|uniref:two-component system response regulator n=1 Tax=Kamptonema TaxID=1501433 RepID=UPI0001DAC5CE|nr:MULTISPECIES: GGDEF domain-containing response regulator [Kamptonema]CBN57953.1 two-component response regulator [Kamptonema sp. PCC 6506]
MNSEYNKKSIVLVVDDHASNLAVLSDYLEQVGFEVWVASDGESALQAVQYEAPDIILLDIMMPCLDGFETCRRLKANPRTKDIPLIFMSALSETVDKVKGLSLGAVDYITKPFQHEEVLVRLRLHLKMSILNKRMEEKNSLLSELTSQLEHRVEARTAELKSAMHELQNAYLELLAKEDKLRYDAFHDSLTGLPNRTWFINQLNRVIELANLDSDYLYAVLFIDLDRFKVVNDSLGHLVGDELLKIAAKRLQDCVPETDIVARLGGDEFIILLEAIGDMNEAISTADRILEQLRLPFIFDKYEIFTGASIGITFSTMGYDRAVDAIRDADVAMYQAKIKGKGCYEVLTKAIQTQAANRLQLENELRKAIELEEFCLYYQPIVSLSTGHLLGFEALVRWQRAFGELVSPAKFIPLAEEIGAINSLGWWIFQEACRQLRLWQQQFPQALGLTLNVNVSPVQLKQANLVERMQKIVEATGVSSSCLKLEITESCFLEASTCEATMLKQLKSQGIKLCIDDFGTGYSSLSRLHEFPIDTLKIDRSFVNRISAGKSDGIVETIVTLAHSFGMDVVAEGIETLEQLEKLCSLGCELGQGYLFSKPVDSQTATQLLLNNAKLLPSMLRPFLTA